jgi:integrase/recombinase XerD
MSNIEIHQNPQNTAIQAASGFHATDDLHLIRLWLHGRSPNTIDGYQRDLEQFLAFLCKPLRDVTLDDIQRFADLLQGYADATIKRRLYAIKSLLAFGHRLGYLQFNAGAPVRVPSVKDTLAERILEESELKEMLSLEEDPRNHALLKLLYNSGVRVSELVNLKWHDFQKRNQKAQITVFGKGRKTRTILLSKSVAEELHTIRGDAKPTDPMFRSKKGGHLHRSQVFRIVRKAAERAGLWQKVSPHWMRHAHASHALDAGAPIHLVQSTLGHTSIATTGRYTHARPNDSSSQYLKDE